MGIWRSQGAAVKIIPILLLGLTILYPAAAKADNREQKLFSQVTQLDAGSRSAYAVKSDGTAWAWGGGYGSIGNGKTTPAYSPVRMHIDHVKEVSGGYRHSLILKEDNSVWAVGGNEHGQLGNGEQSSAVAVEPVQVQGLADITMISAGDNHSLALREDGTVWAWGGNDKGQLGNTTGKDSLLPIQVQGLPEITGIASGMYISAALDKAGKIWVWGHGPGTIGIPEGIRKPELLSGDDKYVAVVIDQQYGVAIREDGTVWMWMNQVWVNPDRKLLDPYQVEGLSDVVSVSIDSAVKADGSVWQWELDIMGRPKVWQVNGISNALSISSGNRNHYVLLKDGYVRVWGTNEFGQAGLGLLDFEFQQPEWVKNSIGVRIDGKDVEVAMPPVLINNSTFVPLRGIFEQLGLQLNWDVKSRSVIAKDEKTTVIINSVTGVTTLNGVPQPKGEKPVFVNDSVYVPLKIVAELLGIKVGWDASSYTVQISTAS